MTDRDLKPSNVLDEALARNLDLGERTRELYRECLADFIAFAGANPQGWNYGAVEDWLGRLLSHGRTAASRERGKCSPQTVRVYRKAIRCASKQYSRRQGKPDLDFARDVGKIKAKPGTAREPLTYEEAGKLLDTCVGASPVNIRDRALLVLALRSGLRRGGLFALMIENIRPPKITTRNKGGDPITFEADGETFSVLNEWLQLLAVAGATRGSVFRDVWAANDGTTQLGEPLTPYQIWSVFRSRAKRAKIRHVFPHLARHSTVTWLREEGKSAAEVSKLTGQTERTIENIYTHVRTRGAVGDAMPSLMKGRKP
jgi:integrase